MVADRRYDYGDPISPLDFVRHGIFVSSIVSPVIGKSLGQPLVIGLAFNLSGCRRFRSMNAVEDPQRMSTME